MGRKCRRVRETRRGRELERGKDTKEKTEAAEMKRKYSLWKRRESILTAARGVNMCVCP